MITVLVCGGRDYSDQKRVDRVLDALLRSNLHMTIVHGACGWDSRSPGGVSDMKGADYCAHDWAHRNNCEVFAVPAAWSVFGPKAGPMRNASMLRGYKPNLVVAFAGGRGTLNMKHQANEAGVPVLEVSP